jgi:hypothetical protein
MSAQGSKRSSDGQFMGPDPSLKREWPVLKLGRAEHDLARARIRDLENFSARFLSLCRCVICGRLDRCRNPAPVYELQCSRGHRGARQKSGGVEQCSTQPQKHRSPSDRNGGASEGVLGACACNTAHFRRETHGPSVRPPMAGAVFCLRSLILRAEPRFRFWTPRILGTIFRGV